MLFTCVFVCVCASQIYENIFQKISKMFVAIGSAYVFAIYKMTHLNISATKSIYILHILVFQKQNFHFSYGCVCCESVWVSLEILNIFRALIVIV